MQYVWEFVDRTSELLLHVADKKHCISELESLHAEGLIIYVVCHNSHCFTYLDFYRFLVLLLGQPTQDILLEIEFLHDRHNVGDFVSRVLIDGGSAPSFVHFQMLADLKTAKPSYVRVPLYLHAQLFLGVKEDSSFLLKSAALHGGQPCHDSTDLVLLPSLNSIGYDGFWLEQRDGPGNYIKEHTSRTQKRKY